MSTQQQLDLDAILRQGSLDTDGDVPTLRAAFNELMSRVPLPADVQRTPTTIAGVDGIEVSLPGGDLDKVILYFPGGVYVIGSAATSVGLVGELARHARVRAV